MFPWQSFVEKPYRICCIDPGSDTMGVSYLDVDLAEQTITVIESSTFDASRYIDQGHIQTSVWGARFARIAAHQLKLYNSFQTFQPHLIVAESPFMGRFPQAFETLVEVRAAIASAAYCYNPAMGLELMDPPTAKKAVGALTKKGSKENVQASVLALGDLIWKLPYPLEWLDEHCYDSVAVGYATALSILAGKVYPVRN